jgi:D-alanyl-D-alanine carboxypeptidase
MRGVFLLLSFLLAQSATAQYAREAGQMIEPYVWTNNFSGAILVERKGQIVLRHAFGLANAEHGVPATMDTRFYIASVSKTFTAAAILQLRDAGKLTVDDPLSRFVPDFPRADRITIRQLLTHRSGIAQDASAPDYFARATHPFTLLEAVDQIRKAPPAAEPGARRAYANPNYVLLALVVERASGEPYADYLRRHVFAPLQMTTTGLHESWLEVVPNRAQGYSPVGARDLYNARTYEYSIGTGAGSGRSTAGDMLRWVHGLLAGTILKRSSVEEMFGLSGAEAFVGASFTAGEHRAIELTGWDGVGFAAAIIFSPDGDVVTVVLSNRNVPSVASDLAEGLTKLAYGERVPSLELDAAPLSADVVRGLAGRYRLGDDFYVPGTILELVPCGEELCEKQSDGRLVALLRTKSGDYIHRSSWGHVEFQIGADGTATGLKFYGRFQAPRIAQ